MNDRKSLDQRVDLVDFCICLKTDVLLDMQCFVLYQIVVAFNLRNWEFL